MTKSQCRSCSRYIIWAKTKDDKPIPIDPDPVLGGNIELENRGRMKPPLATFPIKVDNMTAKRYVSHFATCPEAKKWRKK